MLKYWVVICIKVKDNIGFEIHSSKLNGNFVVLDWRYSEKTNNVSKATYTNICFSYVEVIATKFLMSSSRSGWPLWNIKRIFVFFTLLPTILLRIWKWIKRLVLNGKPELLELREHRGSALFFNGSMLLIILVFCVELFALFVVFVWSTCTKCYLFLWVVTTFIQRRTR